MRAVSKVGVVVANLGDGFAPVVNIYRRNGLEFCFVYLHAADTGTFSRDAKNFARTIQQYLVILVDGDDLVRLMIENKVGVTVSRTVEVVEIDGNFCSEQ